MTAESLKAADVLAEKGISARVVDMFTIKPLDKELVLKCAEETGAVVTAENHSMYNGQFGRCGMQRCLQKTCRYR